MHAVSLSVHWERSAASAERSRETLRAYDGASAFVTRVGTAIPPDDTTFRRAASRLL